MCHISRGFLPALRFVRWRGGSSPPKKRNSHSSKISNRVRVLAVDFDDTISHGDTTAILPKLARERLALTRPAEAEELRTRWDRLVVEYFRRYKYVLTKGLEEEPRRDEDLREAFARFLDIFTDVERWSTSLVVKDRYLRGIPHDCLLKVAPEIAVHPHVFDCIRLAMLCGVEVSIVSIGWSNLLIRSVLAHHGVPSEDPYGYSPAALDLQVAAIAAAAGGQRLGRPVRVFSNDLQVQVGVDGSVASTGVLIQRVVNAHDKEQIMRHLVAATGADVQKGWTRPGSGAEATRWRSLSMDTVEDLASLRRANTGSSLSSSAASVGDDASPSDVDSASGSGDGSVPASPSSGDSAEGEDVEREADGEEGLAVYVGDSMTDVAAMLAADVGIVFGSSDSTRRVCAKFGVGVVDIAARTVRDEDWPALVAQTRGKVLFRATSWSEISAFLFPS